MRSPYGGTARRALTRQVIAVGAAMAFMKAPVQKFKTVLEDQFGHKKADVVDANLKAAEAGIRYALEKWGAMDFGLPFTDTKRPFLTGNQALALGAMAAGCSFYSFYPMTPATSIGQFLADNGPEFGVLVKQVEDEIGVINMAIGAAHAGCRAMCATSGGGFALATSHLHVGSSGTKPTAAMYQLTSSVANGPDAVACVMASINRRRISTLSARSETLLTPNFLVAPCALSDRKRYWSFTCSATMRSPAVSIASL